MVPNIIIFVSHRQVIVSKLRARIFINLSLVSREIHESNKSIRLTWVHRVEGAKDWSASVGLGGRRRAVFL